MPLRELTFYLEEDEMALWTPQVLGSSVVLAWWKADAITGISDAAGVPQWDDSSGNGNHAVQATGGNQPIYVAAGPAVSFVDASNQYFNVTTLSTSVLSRTFVGVVNVDASPGVSLLLGASAAGGLSLRVPGTSSKLEMAKDATTDFGASTGNITTGAKMLIHNTTGATTWTTGINGTQNSGVHALSLTAARTTLFGKYQGGTTNDFDGDVHELIVCTELSDANRQKVEGYMAHRWGTTSALDASHPYKSAAPLVPGGSRIISSFF